MSEAQPTEIKCPYCGASNFVGVYCQECGKKIRYETPKTDEANTRAYQPPPTMNGRSDTPHAPMAHRSRNVMIAVVIGIIAVALVSGLLSLNILQTGANDKGSSNPTPYATLAPTFAQPTSTATLAPIVTATPTATYTQSIEITGINLQIQYAGSDQGYFGSSSQTVTISNQPDQILTVDQGSQFFLYFTLTESSTAPNSDSISAVTVGTAGFTLMSVEPQTPIAFTPGGSHQITVTLTAPQTPFNGPVQLVLSTSGVNPTSSQPPQ